MKNLHEILTEHAFFRGLTPQDLAFIAGCASNVVFKEKQSIAHYGDRADEFFLIREGLASVSLESPPRKPFVFYTLGSNEILGLSSFIPPYQWTTAAHAVEKTHAFRINAACLREKCEKDPRMGFMLMKNLVQVLVQREEAACLHLLDVYGPKSYNQK